MHGENSVPRFHSLCTMTLLKFMKMHDCFSASDNCCVASGLYCILLAIELRDQTGKCILRFV